MPIIKNDFDLREYFLDHLRGKCASILPEVTVSDLVYCLRKAYWRKHQPERLSEKQLVTFLDGKQRHQILQGLVPSFEHEKEVQNHGVIGKLDLSYGHPIEIKTTKARYRDDWRPSTYLRQCAYYCVLTNNQLCNLITQYINDGIFKFELIEFSSTELSNYLVDMSKDRSLLLHAHNINSPNELPYGYPSGNWQCQNCEFQANCGI